MADDQGMDSRLRGNDGVAVVPKGGFETRPYRMLVGRGLFSEESFMSVPTNTTKHENGREVGEGYFQGNDRRVCYPGERDSANRMKNCRLSGLAMASMLTA